MNCKDCTFIGETRFKKTSIHRDRIIYWCGKYKVQRSEKKVQKTNYIPPDLSGCKFFKLKEEQEQERLKRKESKRILSRGW